MLTVVSVAYPLAPVGPDAIGGAEQVLHAVDRALVASGHRSIVIACEGSRCHGELVSSGAPPAAYDDAVRARASVRQRRLLDRVLDRQHVDLVHLHGLDTEAYLDIAQRVPVVATLHLPPAWYPPEALQTAHEDLHFVCVSQSQRNTCPIPASALHVIPNGVDLSALRPARRKLDFALTIGRICPEKGFHLAIEAAQRADMTLLLGGAAFPYAEHERYLRERIRPLLDSRRKLVGPLSFARKRRLLGFGGCLVVPSRVPETSSLVAMEALACGTPVVAFPVGALSEIVEHGRTGLLVENVDDMAAALESVSALRGEDCRRAAETRFSAQLMTRRYLELFEEVAKPPSSRRAAPREKGLATSTLTRLDALEALRPEWEDLWQRSSSATVFQRPEWLLQWMRTFAGGGRRVIALRDGPELVALAPAYVRRGGHGSELALAGAGNSDYLDVLVDPNYAALALPALMRQATALGARRFVLECVPPDSALLAEQAPRGYTDELELETVCPFLPLDYRDGGSSLGSHAAAQPRRGLRRAQHLGELRCERATTDFEIDEFLGALFSLHAARWRARGKRGVLEAAALQRFHRKAAHDLHAAGMLLLWGLRVDGRLASVLYGFRDRGCDRYYLSGFDPALSRYGPGVLLLEYAIEQASAAGMREVDFLRGREAYKYRFAAAERPVYRREIAPVLGARPSISR